MRIQAQRNLIGWFALVALFIPCTLRAQQSSGTEQAPKGMQSGDYNVQQTIEFGYRNSSIDGNTNNYDTFENLGSGVRLFDYTLNMQSKNHNGLFFDNLTFSNF